MTWHMRRVTEGESVIRFTLPDQALDLTGFPQSSDISVQLAPRLTKRNLIRTVFCGYGCCEPESEHIFYVLNVWRRTSLFFTVLVRTLSLPANCWSPIMGIGALHFARWTSTNVVGSLTGY
jgi:hypothetical protein